MMFNKQGKYITFRQWFKELLTGKPTPIKYTHAQNYDLYRKIEKQYKKEEEDGWNEYTG